MSRAHRSAHPHAAALAALAATLLAAAPAHAQATPDFVTLLRERGLAIAFGVAFLGGLLTSLTPCVYPMIPITVAVFGARGATRLRGLTLSLLYVLGIASTYTALGVWAALSGKLFGAVLANPWVLGGYSLLFALLGLYMLGLFPQVDTWLSRPMGWASRIGGRGLPGSFAMGLVAGVVFAPCVAPVLLGILTYVTATRDVLLGGSLLFVFALGMGALFVVLGTFSGSLTRLPRSDRLMKTVKTVLAALVFTGAFYFFHLVASPGLFRAALALGLGLFGLYLALPLGLGAPAGAARRAVQLGALALIALGAAVGGGRVVGAEARAQPGAVIAWRGDHDAALAEAAKAGRPAIIDFGADWCLACNELEERTFRDPAVVAEAARFTMVRVDATRMDDPAIEAILARQGVVGLPAVLFVDPAGHTLADPRVTRFIEAPDFLALMRRVGRPR